MLYDSVTTLSGVGKVRAQQLAQLNIHTLFDLISHFPRAYEDRTKFVDMDQLVVDEPACFKAIVVSGPRTNYLRKGLDITKAMVSDNTAQIGITFFNNPYVVSSLSYGKEYCFYGKLSGDYKGYQIVSPDFEPVQFMGTVTNRILPIYPLTAGITNKSMVKLVAQAFACCGEELTDLLPLELQAQYDICSTAFAYANIHNPASFDDLEKAKSRLIFEEFFVFSLGLQMVRTKRQAKSRMPLSPVEMSPFYNALGFVLTGAQKRTIEEILTSFSQPTAMNRLVQGDVGSGKTAVAAAATFAVASNGGQVAFMAPTEILAEQHHRALSALFAPLGITTALLTGSLKAREKTAIKGDIASGNVQLVIGTHALITSDVAFQNLELVIADEQHKFGVAQRAALAEKGFAPHLLVMSATPIPRTLALILYGDLDVSIMDELPPGRQTIDSFLVSESKRHRMYNFIRQQVENSNQVYVVCPAIEDNPDSDLTPAAVVAEELGNVIFPDLTVGLLHGKMKAAEKEAVMHQYAGGEIQILVSTTVVEVGVDVPNTTLMVIENADRFGLSQLHQLRGRVGRGKDKSFCVLISNNTNVETRARLKTFCSTTNGFEIAQADLELRGPGDFFGSRQSGLPLFKVANLALDLDVLKTAQDASITYLQSHPNIQSNKPLIARISNLFEENMALN